MQRINQIRAYGIALIFLCGSISAYLTRVHAARALVTNEEVNSAEIYSSTLPSIFRIETELDSRFLMQGDSNLSKGSGIYIGHGKVITTFDTIQNSVSVNLYSYNGTQFTGKIKFFDKSRNLALLELNKEYKGSPQIFVKSNILPGQSIYSLGNNGKIDRFLAKSIIGKNIKGNEVRRSDGLGSDISDYIATSLAISEDSSGTPIIDTHGQIVGIVDYNAIPDKQFLGIYTFAIPNSVIIKFLNEAKKAKIY